jgi:transposase
LEEHLYHGQRHLYHGQRHLFQGLDLVFFDTTSLYFDGEGGEILGERGYGKDHRPDLNQMVVGAVLDSHGRPICCEMWPGNTTDVKTLIPIARRIQKRFQVARFCCQGTCGKVFQAVGVAVPPTMRKIAGWIPRGQTVDL